MTEDAPVNTDALLSALVGWRRYWGFRRNCTVGRRLIRAATTRLSRHLTGHMESRMR